MSLLRFLGIEAKQAPAAAGETRSVREIAARLERLPAETARHLAGFALDADDKAGIAALDTPGGRVGPDPAHFPG